MSTATMTSKGQITIPVQVRQSMNVETGDRVEFVEMAPGQFMLIVANCSVQQLKGMFGKAAKTVSVEQMNHAISVRGSSAR